MTRWSLSNIFRPVSHKQFTDYAAQFKRAAENSFGTACKLQITAMSRTKVYTTFWDDDIQSSLNEINDANTILRTENLDEVTPEIWKKAGYVEVGVRPVDESEAPDYAFGHAEFKGNRPRQACFYIQPDGEDARKEVLDQHSRKFVGDGFESNGTRSGAIPSSLAKFGFHF